MEGQGRDPSRDPGCLHDGRDRPSHVGNGDDVQYMRLTNFHLYGHATCLISDISFPFT